MKKLLAFFQKPQPSARVRIVDDDKFGTTVHVSGPSRQVEAHTSSFCRQGMVPRSLIPLPNGRSFAEVWKSSNLIQPKTRERSIPALH